jgi:diaminohydroxyphosphoribosylaminopyrimidine deaminase/5-amino-6-(5-phosphoribosylamino)uracil reductase
MVVGEEAQRRTAHELVIRRQSRFMLVFETPTAAMQHDLALATRGLGAVEPNPPVGAVIVDDTGRCLGEGWHQKFGGPHAEIFALEQAGAAARSATLYVTLEPCCHFGKTPPCSRAVIAAGVKRVMVAMTDPAPHVAGGGIAELRSAGIAVDVGLCETEARALTAPFICLITEKRPWVHAKWAMTLDGKIASRTGHSQWITGSQSRAVVHSLRGRMDAIVAGIGTVIADDPLLTARTAGPRTATRVVIDPHARLPLTSQLVQTAREVPVLWIIGDNVPTSQAEPIIHAGVECLRLPHDSNTGFDHRVWLSALGLRGMTHVFVEGGGKLLGSLFDADLVDEYHVFIAPKFVGGAAAPSPLGGHGLERIPGEPSLQNVAMMMLDGDFYVHGRRQRA